MRRQIRKTKPADAPFLPALERSAGEAFRTIPSLAWIADADDQSVETHLAHIAAGTSWVATDEAGGPIGFLAAEVCDDELHIEEFSVRLDRQGSGCGRALMAEAIAWAKARALRAVTLTTFRDVPWNAPYYARKGFRVLAGHEIGSRLADALRREVERGFPGERRCAMRLDLSPASG
jgi:GNAT superfamily N-acetyltransferase